MPAYKAWKLRVRAILQTLPLVEVRVGGSQPTARLRALLRQRCDAIVVHQALSSGCLRRRHWEDLSIKIDAPAFKAIESLAQPRLGHFMDLNLHEHRDVITEVRSAWSCRLLGWALGDVAPDTRHRLWSCRNARRSLK